jgi:predicted nucleic acid-binding protein
VNSYVLDARVAAKWFLPPGQEQLAAEARLVLHALSSGTCNLVAPDLFWPEMGNILWKAARLGRISGAVYDAAVDSLDGLSITTVSSRPLLRSAAGIARAFDRSVYDCTYVALAVESNTPLLTADERLANALSARFPLRWLGAVSF